MSNNSLLEWAIEGTRRQALVSPTLPNVSAFSCGRQRKCASEASARPTIAVTERPFAPAIAASRGEQPGDVEAWLEDLAGSLAGHDVEVEGRVVTSTGYTLYDTMEGLEADLLVVKAEPDGSLPKHMDWLYQVIPTRLLLVRGG